MCDVLSLKLLQHFRSTTPTLHSRFSLASSEMILLLQSNVHGSFRDSTLENSDRLAVRLGKETRRNSAVRVCCVSCNYMTQTKTSFRGPVAVGRI